MPRQSRNETAFTESLHVMVHGMAGDTLGVNAWWPGPLGNTNRNGEGAWLSSRLQSESVRQLEETTMRSRLAKAQPSGEVPAIRCRAIAEAGG